MFMNVENINMISVLIVLIENNTIVLFGQYHLQFVFYFGKGIDLTL